MKSVLVACMIGAASATPAANVNCQIPSTYTATSGTGCGGPNVGYKVFGYCSTGTARGATGFLAGSEVRVEMTQANLPSFTSDATDSTNPGCVIPAYSRAWNVAAPVTMAAPLIVSAASCDAGAASFNPAISLVKGVEIVCDRAAGYYPSRGFEGSAFCVDGTAVVPFPGSTPAADYFQYPSSFAAAAAGVHLNEVSFTGANALLCSQGCTLPANVCNAGLIHANIVAYGYQFDPTTCTVLPLPVGLAAPTLGGSGVGVVVPGVPGIQFPINGVTFPLTAGTQLGNFGLPFVQFSCRTGYSFSPVWTATCTTDAVTGVSTSSVVPAYTGQCGGVDGAATNLLFDIAGSTTALVGAQTAGQIANFAAVTSTVAIGYTVAASAYATLWTRRYWNNNAQQALQSGSTYNLNILGCETLAGLARQQCVQQTTNWWRCIEDYPINAGTLCWVNSATPIACPSHELGFRCPSSSKKGLLGLLGLLGLIPLFLLCCCLFFLCCIRRRKTEADVHFATFDPHAAPVIATAPCATATACPTAFGATPFATHPSAIPCL